MVEQHFCREKAFDLQDVQTTRRFPFKLAVKGFWIRLWKMAHLLKTSQLNLHQIVNLDQPFKMLLFQQGGKISALRRRVALIINI